MEADGRLWIVTQVNLSTCLFDAELTGCPKERADEALWAYCQNNLGVVLWCVICIAKLGSGRTCEWSDTAAV